jgi:UDP-N-acetylmuramoylalanine--D-glutamate ligase
MTTTVDLQATVSTDWAGVPVLILGLGDSGLAMARWCVRAGARVRVWDSRPQPPQAAALAAEAPQVQFFTGPLGAEALADAQRVLKSPGLSPLDARLVPLLQAAQAAGVPVQGELGVFAQALAALRAGAGYAPQVLAITGTNGKTTTTSLTARLVERCDRRVGLAGNIGPSMLDTLGTALREATLPEVWVLELSSFQLDEVVGFEPSAGAVLNITQDHLDWHGSMDAYAQAKAHVFGAQGVMVINRDDPLVEALVPAPQTVSMGRGKPRQTVGRSVCRFGLNPPQRPGDFGLVDDNGMAGARPARRRHPTQTWHRSRTAAPATPDASRCAAHSGASQRCQRAGRAGAGHGDWLPVGADAARPARVHRRAAPCRVGGPSRRHGGV